MGRMKINLNCFTELQQIVSDLGNDNIIFCGDRNLILNETLDTEIM